VGKTVRFARLCRRIRNGGDVAKALASVPTPSRSATRADGLNCNKDIPEADYEKEIGVKPGTAITAQRPLPGRRDHSGPASAQASRPDSAAERVYNFLHCLTIECQMMAGLRQDDVTVWNPRIWLRSLWRLGARHGPRGSQHTGRSARYDPLLR